MLWSTQKLSQILFQKRYLILFLIFCTTLCKIMFVLFFLAIILVTVNLFSLKKVYTNHKNNTLCQHSYRNKKLLLHDYKNFVFATLNTSLLVLNFVLVLFM